jgi:glucose-1-phosphate adenylyltransferase
VESDASLEHCIVMERSRIGRGARLRRCIVDQDNDVPPGERIGFDAAADRRRFHVSESGIVVVPAGHFPRCDVGSHIRSELPSRGLGEAGLRMEELA